MLQYCDTHDTSHIFVVYIDYMRLVDRNNLPLFRRPTTGLIQRMHRMAIDANVTIFLSFQWTNVVSEDLSGLAICDPLSDIAWSLTFSEGSF